ncbi:MAG: cyclic nucleotide-binding domain-containing protein [Planctomycetaceae bacterium]
MSDIVDLIPRVQILAACDIRDREAFERTIERECYAPGQTIITEGETDRALWMILKGNCEVVKSENGHPGQRLATLETGTVFGEMSFFRPAPHSATVRAIDAVEVGRLSTQAFRELQDRNPAAAVCIMANLVSLLSDRLRRMDERICEVLAESASHRQDEWQDFRARLFATSDFS